MFNGKYSHLSGQARSGALVSRTKQFLDKKKA